jgi:hypothetical protein
MRFQVNILDFVLFYLFYVPFADGREHDAVPVHQPGWCADPLPQRGGQATGIHGDQAVHRGQAHHTEGEPTAGLTLTL